MTSVEEKNKSNFDIIEFVYKYLSFFKKQFRGTSRQQTINAIENALNTCTLDMKRKFAQNININLHNDWGLEKSESDLSEEISEKILTDLHNVKLDTREQFAVAASSKILVWLLKMMIIQNDEKTDLRQEKSNLHTLKVLLYDVILQFGISGVTLLFYKWLKNEHMKRHIKTFLKDVSSKESVND